MGLLYNIINGFVYKYNEWRSIINEKKKIKDARRVNLLKQVHLTNKQKREIDTFPASHIHKPERKTYADDIDSYNLGRGYGLELRRRRRDRRGIIM